MPTSHTSFFYLAIALAGACGDDDPSGSPDGGNGPDAPVVCVARDAVRIADADRIYGLAHEGGAPRVLIARTTPPTLAIVEDTTERVLTSVAVAGAALAKRWDGELCAAWVGIDDTFHAACGPDWTEIQPAFAVEQSHGNLALAFPTRACGQGLCVDAERSVALYSDISLGAVIDDGTGWRLENLFTSSISFFGQATVFDGRPWACAVAPLGNAALFGEDVTGDLELFAIDADQRATSCRLASDGGGVYGVWRDNSTALLRWFGAIAPGNAPNVTNVPLPFTIDNNNNFAVAPTATGASILYAEDGALQAVAFDRAAGTFATAQPVGVFTMARTFSNVAAARADNGVDLAVTADGGVFLARTCD